MAAAALVAVLLLQPVLAEPGPLRLVALGTGDVPVQWSVDGVAVAWGSSGVPITVPVSAGPHTVTARAEFGGPWEVMVRPDPSTVGLASVPAWTASTPGTPPAVPEPIPGGSVPLCILGLLGLASVRSRFGL